MPRILLYPLLALVTLLTSTATHAEWQRIVVDRNLLDGLFGTGNVSDSGRLAYTDDDGIERYPGCALGTVQIPEEGSEGDEPAANSFFFFVDMEAAPPDDLLIFFTGGGACWDGLTCIASPFSASSTYSPVINETAPGLEFFSNDPEGSGGIISNRLDNPFAEYSRVYIPYCTGDVHVGSSDTIYPEANPHNLTIHHRGFDNVLVVMEWLKDYYSDAEPSRVTVSGSSAGGYGALLNFPVVRDTLGEQPKFSVVIDGANGVLNNDFVDRTFGSSPSDPGAWNARDNIAGLLQPVLDLDAFWLWHAATDTLADEYHDTRFSQVTTAYDGVQARILKIMQDVASNSFNPFEPYTDGEIALTAVLEWSPRARLSMIWTSWRNRHNYRYFLAPGSDHALLITPPELGDAAGNFFDQRSGGTYLNDWLDDMLNRNSLWFTKWKNKTCFPGCLQF